MKDAKPDPADVFATVIRALSSLEHDDRMRLLRALDSYFGPPAEAPKPPRPDGGMMSR